MSLRKSSGEIPPTAGLPLQIGDWLPPWRNTLAQDLAHFLEVPRLAIECSGTASLIVILETLRRLSPRKTVVIPAYTCPLVVFAVLHCGLQVRLCDTRPDSFELDPQDLARQCDSDTLAVVPTHLGGRVSLLAEVIAQSRQCGAYVVEDAAQALGARWQGQSVGLSGDAGFFSLAVGKGLSIFEGGAWLSANPALEAELGKTRHRLIERNLRQESWRCLQLLGYTLAYRPWALRQVYGKPLRHALRRQDWIAAAGDYFSPEVPVHQVGEWRQSIGSKALTRLRAFQQQLAEQARRRRAVLACIPGLEVLNDPPNAQGTWPVLILRLPDARRRDLVLAETWGAGLGLARMFVHALPDYPYLRPWLAPQAVPNAQAFAACTLTVSNSPWLDEARFARILTTLERHCR